MPGRILVIDDDKTICHLVSGALAPAGYSVEAVMRGADGLARAQTLRPDGILLDVQMPDLDGFEVGRRLKADPRTADVPIIMLTASEDRSLFQKAKEAGAVACIPKPFRSTSLVATVDSVLSGAKGQAGA